MFGLLVYLTCGQTSARSGGGMMDKTTLLAKLSELIDDAASTRLFGNIQIDFVNGVPELLRKLSTQKMNKGNPYERIERR